MSRPSLELWVARDADGTVRIWTKQPEWCEFIGCWMSPTGSFDVIGILYSEADEWPDEKFPRGRMGIARLIIDETSVITAHAPDDNSAPSVVDI